MTIHLVRHAHAGKRSDWDDDDRNRPLSPKGLQQALGLKELLAATEIGRVVSSPYRRCLQTVTPVAQSRGLAVEESAPFTEGTAPRDAVEALLALDAHNGVACSHGDIIPPVLRALVAMGMQTEYPLIDQKGSLWIIETADGLPVRGIYHPPSIPEE